jgi:hypothetical protein
MELYVHPLKGRELKEKFFDLMTLPERSNARAWNSGSMLQILFD